MHEPSYYSTPDYPDWRAGFENKIYEEKRNLLEENGIVIWRDHDHSHAHKPDSIFTGVIKYLGWQDNQTGEDGMAKIFEFSDMTVEKMNKMLKRKTFVKWNTLYRETRGSNNKGCTCRTFIAYIFEHQATTGNNC